MKSKEALEKINIKQVAVELFNIVSNGKYDMNEIVPYFDRIDKALAELEELKKCVIIFLSFCSFQITDGLSEEERNAVLEVYNKLSKAGKEDV